MDPIANLTEAARAGDINGLYKLITGNPTVLEVIDKKPLDNTPLHEAASAGQTNFALEMISLAPSFGRKLNPDGLTPLDLALKNNHYETVKGLVCFDRELVRVKGKDGLTPLHRCAESDDKIGCLIELLLACPASIKDLTIRGETALHVAMKSSSTEAFQILYEWVSRAGDKQLLLKKDAKGNSADAHHSNLKPQTVKSLQGVQAEKPSLASADDDTRNMFTYLRTPERFYERQVRKVLAFMLWSQRGLTMEMRNVVLVVAVLIATASFQAVFSPPVGEHSGLAIHANSNSIQNRSGSFAFAFSNGTTYDFKKNEGNGEFYLLNTIAFTASVGVIIIVLQLRAYTLILHLSLIFMMATYWFFLNRCMGGVAFVRLPYNIASSVYLFWAYYFKILLWTMTNSRPELLAMLLFLPCLKQNFRCLQQMGALTSK